MLLCPSGVLEVLLRDLPHDSHLDKVMIQKHATIVLEPTSDLARVQEQLSVIVPNAVTMEKSSCDTVDYNSMFHNAIEVVKSKVQ